MRRQTAKAGALAYVGGKFCSLSWYRAQFSKDLCAMLTSCHVLIMVVSMSNESDSQTYEDRAWQYFLQLQPSITDVNAAAELAFRAVDAFERQLKRRTGRDS